MAVSHLLPEVQWIRQNGNGSFVLPDGASLLLQVEEEQPGLVALARALFPAASLRATTSPGQGYFLAAEDGTAAIDEEKKQRAVQRTEAYYLKLAGNSLRLHAGGAAGLFYGLQTLRQLLAGEAPLPETEIEDWPDLAFRCANFDLRLLYPKFDKLLEYIETLASFKYNALLVEFEDKLPFRRYPHLRHGQFAFTREQLQRLQETARRNFIELIPLQQTFGHLEYVLKHDRHRPLQETPEAIGELCPSRPESLELATGLIEEMIEAHPESRYLHLGCDEVWCLCHCPRCQAAFGGSKAKTFITYVNQLINFTAERGRIPIIWHDMLAHCSDEELSLLDRRAVVMIWLYDGKEIEARVENFTHRCRHLKIKVLGAPAIRAWDRTDDQPHPVALNRIRNVDQWTRAANRLQIPGLVATNWATVFGMGVPYGIFETTWFLIGYAADQFWKADADRTGFLLRFLTLFHGIDPAAALPRLGNHDPEDYYEKIGSLVDLAEKNRDVAEHLRLIKLHETAVARSRTIHKYIYRSTLSDNESETISLGLKRRETRRLLNEIRPQLEANLRTFMPEEMVDHFMKSRFFLHDWLEEHLYPKLIPAGEEGE